MTTLRIYRNAQGHGRFEESRSLDALPALMDEDGTVVWAAVEAPGEEEMDRILAMLDLHPLAAEDLRENGDRPRLRRYADRLSIVFMAVKGTVDGEGALRFVRMNIFTGPRYVVTVTPEPLEDLAEAFTAWKGNADHLPHDASAPLYAVLDTIVDGFFEEVDDLADRVDEVEDQVVERHSPSSLALIFSLKKSMLHFRRIASGARDVVNALLRNDDLFRQDSSLFFQDLYDHTVRITDSIDTYRDLMGNAMDSYLSVTSNQMAESANRLNVVMQTLTAWSIILGSGTFIAGIYGMNVAGLPLASRPGGFLFAAGLCLIVAGLLFALFRRRRWI